MASYARAIISARQHQQVLLYAQAVGYSPQILPGDHGVYERLLAVPSVAHTGCLPGIVLLHVGMRVRLTTQILPPWAVQDATGSVMEIDMCQRDRRCLCSSDVPQLGVGLRSSDDPHLAAAVGMRSSDNPHLAVEIRLTELHRWVCM